MQEALKWGKIEGITFNPKKLKLIYFTRGTKDPLAPISPRVLAGTHIIQEFITPLRWLGVYFNRKLRFKDYTRILAAKALIVGNALRSLSKTTRGVPLIYL